MIQHQAMQALPNSIQLPLLLQYIMEAEDYPKRGSNQHQNEGNVQVIHESLRPNAAFRLRHPAGVSRQRLMPPLPEAGSLAAGAATGAAEAGGVASSFTMRGC